MPDTVIGKPDAFVPAIGAIAAIPLGTLSHYAVRDTSVAAGHASFDKMPVFPIQPSESPT
jgi:hypothetical protein